MPPDTILDAALGYVARGWRVFPVRPGMKDPAVKWKTEHSSDPEKIKRWWSARKDWAKRNLAVVTSPESGIWVLDADVDGSTGELGEGTIEALEKVHGALPAHPIAATPGGGRHHVFAWPDDGEDLPRTIRFAPALDALGSRTDKDGSQKAGYFIAAPSIRLEGVYRWIVSPEQISPPQAPAWLLTMIRAKAKERPVDLPMLKPTRSDRTSGWGRALLDGRCEDIRNAPYGQQEITLSASALRIGSAVAGGAIEMAEAYSTTMAAALAMPAQPGRDPWTRQDIEKKIRSAFAKGEKSPSVPPDRPARPAQAQSQNRPRSTGIVAATPAGKDEKPKSTADEAAWLPPEMRWMAASTHWQWKDADEFILKPASLVNAHLYIELHPDLKEMYRYDIFRDEVFLSRGLPGDNRKDYPRQLNDNDETALATWLNWHGLSPNISTVRALIHEIAFRHSFDPLLDWVNSLEWDGQPRIATWLQNYAGAAPSTYNSIVGTKFMIGAIARAIEPGAKVDAMLIMEGPQNLGKSTAVRELCGAEMFSDQVGDVTSKDSAERIQGCWIVEIPEMDKFSRPEANAVKDFLSRREDRYRPAFGRNVVRRPRRCVFFGTINPDGAGYLKDTTGNRRFWPVTVSNINIDAIRRDRDQLWAEAVDRYRSGEEWWVAPGDAYLVEPEQESRRDDDVWEPKIRAWIEDKSLGRPLLAFTSADCIKDAIGLDLGHQGQREKIRVAKILTMLGCEPRNHANGIKGRSWEYERR